MTSRTRPARSLAIITLDEDNYDFPSVLGSHGVRQGYVSPARYTHYGLLRTIEGALGLGTLTANDRYAPATSGIFIANAPARPGLATPTAGPARGVAAGPVPRSARVRGQLRLGHGDPGQHRDAGGGPAPAGRARRSAWGTRLHR